MSAIELTQDNFEQTITDHDIVLVDFWASWCAPCRAFAPTFEKSSEKHPDIAFGKVNTEEQPGLAAAFQVRSIPTLAIFREQVLIFIQPGALPGAALEDLIGQVRALDMEEVRQKIAEQQAQQEQAAAN